MILRGLEKAAHREPAMTTPINLNKARKAKAKTEKEKRAAENRAKFGRTKADKTLEAARTEKAVKSIEAHRLNQKPDGDG